MDLRGKLQGLAETSLTGLKSVLSGLHSLYDIGVTEVPDVMDALAIAFELVQQSNALEYRIVRQHEGRGSVVLRSSPPDGPDLMHLQNGTSVAIWGRPELGYTRVRVDGKDIDGWAKTEDLHKMALSSDYNTELLRICSQDQTESKVTFFFVKADCLRTSKQPKLPHFQELLDWGWLEKHTFSPGELYRGEWVEHILAISHRWEDANDPDPDGTQLARIRTFVNENHSGKKADLLWFDFWCAPQGKDRTPAEWEYFKWVSNCMDMLYLGGTVLLLVDMSYRSRFWTGFEAWLSMQACSDTGLCPMASHKRRSHIECIHNATEAEEQKLRDMWEKKTPSEAYDVLQAPDVPVSNKSDKDSKLLLIQELNTEVPQHYAIECAEHLFNDKNHKAHDLQQMGFGNKRLCDTAAALHESGTSFKQLREFGFTAGQLKEGGFSARQLRHCGFSAGQLKEGGFSARQLRELGLPAGHLKEGGFSAAQLREGGFSAKQLKEGGFSAKQLKEGGFSARPLNELRFSAVQLKEAGFSARELNEGGFSAVQLKELGFSAVQLKQGGFSAGQLRELGFPAAHLKDLGFSSVQMKEGGFSAGELKEGGFSAKQLKVCFSAGEMKELGFSAEQLKELGFPAGPLKEGGFSAAQLKELGFSAGQLKDGGFSAGQLKELEFSAGELKEGGFSAGELKEGGVSAWLLGRAGFSAGELKHGGFSAVQLKEGGFSAEQLKEGGFSAGQLKKGGFSARQLKDCGFSAGELKDGGVSAWLLRLLGFSAREMRQGGFSAGQLKELGLSAGELNGGGFTAGQLRDCGFSALQLREGGFSAVQLKDGGFTTVELKEGGFVIWI